MKYINEIMNEIKEQEGVTNAYGEDLTAIDIDNNISLYIEVLEVLTDTYWNEDYPTEKYYHIEVIDSESTDILEASCADYTYEALQKEIERLLENNNCIGEVIK